MMPGNLTRIGPRVAGAVAAVLVLGACREAAAPTRLDADQVASIEEADRVLGTSWTAGESAIVRNADAAVVEECMQQLGWDFELGTDTSATASGPSAMSTLEQWTFADVASAESVGYDLESHLADVAVFNEGIDAGGSEVRIPELEAMSAEDALRYELDYFGSDEERVEIVERDGSNHSVPGGGCLGQGRTAVYGDIEQQLRLEDARSTAAGEVWDRTLSNQTVAEALDSWTGCVEAQGYEFEDPHAAFDSAIAAAQAGDHDEERSIAAAAAECTAETGLDVAIEAAYLAATNETLSDLEDDLIAYEQLERESLARAKDILRLGE
jgi:hypothetical protein